jgi:hypothetical protein
MLDCSRPPQLAEAIAGLATDVELPESWADYFSESGVLPTHPQDRRRFARYCLRTAAAMRLVETLPHLQRSDQWFKVYAKDVSRTGFSFLHSTQLFPGECVELVIDESHHYVGKVVRCRKVAPRCFVIGMQFCTVRTTDRDAATS